MDPQETATTHQKGSQIRLGAAQYKLSITILITITGWTILTVIYGYFWVNNVLETETLYGYERSRLLISTAFISYKLPYLLIALVGVLVLELLACLYFERENRS